MFKEFKAFIMRGNVVDLAVGIVIGGAFGQIVSSLVKDIIMPPIGLLLAGLIFQTCSSACRGNIRRWPMPRPPERPPSITACSSTP